MSSQHHTQSLEILRTLAYSLHLYRMKKIKFEILGFFFEDFLNYSVMYVFTQNNSIWSIVFDLKISGLTYNN